MRGGWARGMSWSSASKGCVRPDVVALDTKSWMSSDSKWRWRLFGNSRPTQVRAQILANLHRWERQGVWVSAFDEWREIANGDDDGELFAAMLGRNEKAVRLRQSAPYAGLLSPQEVCDINEEAAG